MSRSDVMRALIDLALASGKESQSKKTGFVHDEPELISTVSNALFALALFRQKTQESVTEGKQLLQRLLAFQQTERARSSFGNFPQYIHDYPNCRDHYTAAKIVAPLFWIQKEFHHLLGQELKERLHQAIEYIHEFVEGLKARLDLPAWIICRFFDTHALSYEWHTFTFEQLGQMISSLSIRPHAAIRTGLLQYLQAIWHQNLSRLIAPQIGSQHGFHPAVTLCDYYASYLSGSISKRVLVPQLSGLQAALIYPLQDDFSEIFERDAGSWSVQKKDEWASCVNRDSTTPWQLIVGQHSLQLQLHCGRIISVNTGEIILEVAEELSAENIEEAEAFSIFVTANGVAITIGGQKATRFSLADEISIIFDHFELVIKVELMQGDLNLVGHLIRGNRAQQVKGSECYDWQLLWRKVRGSSASVKVGWQLLKRNEGAEKEYAAIELQAKP